MGRTTIARYRRIDAYSTADLRLACAPAMSGQAVRWKRYRSRAAKDANPMTARSLSPSEPAVLFRSRAEWPDEIERASAIPKRRMGGFAPPPPADRYLDEAEPGHD